MGHAVEADGETLIFLPELRLHNRYKILQYLRKGYAVLTQYHLPAFDFRHIQNIIDQPQ